MQTETKISKKEAVAYGVLRGSVLAPLFLLYLTIIPRARMGSESIAHEAEGRMGY